jgi:hypothetical protein
MDSALMKKLIAILILSLACYSAEARNLMVVGGVVPVAGGAGTWYYNGGSDSYANTGSEGNTVAIGGVIDLSGIGVGKNATKVSVNLGSVGTSTECIVALFSDNTTNWLSVQNGVVSAPTTGWNDVTITTTALTASATGYSVAAICNGTWGPKQDTRVCTGCYYWAEGQTYGNWTPVSIEVIYGDNEAKGVRVWVE